jgi:uncharacterized membrane protein YkoI
MCVLSVQASIADGAKTNDAALKKKAKISKRAAEKEALKAVGGGTIFDSELEREDGKIIYSFDISQKKLIKEVHVDAVTGKVLSVKSEEAKHEVQEKEKK